MLGDPRHGEFGTHGMDEFLVGAIFNCPLQLAVRPPNTPRLQLDVACAPPKFLPNVSPSTPISNHITVTSESDKENGSR